MIKIFKFGGASVKDADSIKNMSSILKQYQNESLVVVVSAMGKTTNLLESLLVAARQEMHDFEVLFNQLIDFHINICNNLFENRAYPVYTNLHSIFDQLRNVLLDSSGYNSFDEHYDASISYGELLSTSIIDTYLSFDQHNFFLIDARDYIVTDETFRQANVDWDYTSLKINSLKNFLGVGVNILTQGFIGRSHESRTTTLGREGSDYTAAVFASCLDASEVTIWKDVPGLLNADPKRFAETTKLNVISYPEAIELAYYGATIIHPKTIKPLQNKRIPLKVKSFLQPDLPASVVCESAETDSLIPSYIIKDQQVLISISPRDFSFMDEMNLYRIIGVFAELKIPINVMQTSALSLSICTDFNADKLVLLIEKLHLEFTVRYNEHLTLLTIRHYHTANLPEIVEHKDILLEQRSRVTLQLVYK